LVFYESVIAQLKPKKKSSPTTWELTNAWDILSIPSETDTAWFTGTSGPCSIFVSTKISTLFLDKFYGQKVILPDTVKLGIKKNLISQRFGQVTDFTKGEVEFYGSENAVIENVTPIGTTYGKIIKIKKLTINKDPAATVTILNQSVQCDTLVLNGGTLQTGSYKIIVGDSTTAKPGVIISNGGFVEGTVSLYVTPSSNTEVEIPLVKSGLKRTIRLSNFIGSFGPLNQGKLEISFENTAPGDNGLPLDENESTMTTASSDGFWRITKGDDLLSASYDISLTAENFSSILDVSNVRILKRSTSSNPWTLQGLHSNGTGSNSLPTVHRTGLTDFSEFAISQGTGSPLPIELLEFKAVDQTLVWKVSDISLINYFSLSYSTDLQDWERISSMTPTLAHDYSQKVNQNGFYRLEIVDLNGLTKTSITEVKKPHEHQTSTAVVQGRNLATNCPDDTQILILSYSGTIILEETTQGNKIFDLSSLPAGIYILKVGEKSEKIFLE